jgi:hypothetical protein
MGMRFLFQTNVNGPFVFKCLKRGAKIIDVPKEVGTDEFLETPCVIKLKLVLWLIFLYSLMEKMLGKLGIKKQWK